MYKIFVYQESAFHMGLLLEYKSNILPTIGDIYAASRFKDGMQRQVVSRVLSIEDYSIDSIIINVDYSFPNLLTKDENV